jgi:TorA-specific chaperone
MNALDTTPSLAADAGWSAMVVEWLAGLFLTAPTPQVAASYRDGLGAILLDAIAEEPGCGPGAERMRLAVRNGGSPERIAARLGGAFARLFDGVGGPLTASPYESAHVSRSGSLFQAPTGAMERLLRQNSLARDPGCSEPADHISLELALLGRLMRIDGGGRIEAILLDRHLLVWVPRFAARCRDADETGFYDGAASVLIAQLMVRRARLAPPARARRRATANATCSGVS